MKHFFAIIRELLTGEKHYFYWDEGEKPDDYRPEDYIHDN
jgi:hypothetical protein